MSIDTLENKVILVTGTSRGIGRQIAKTFAQNGAIVYANARTEGTLDSLVEEVSGCSGRIVPIYFDVTDYQASKKTVLQIKKEQGHIDVLVNNAGVMKDAAIGMIAHENIQQTFDVNVFAVMELLQYTARIMMKQKSGSIINMASIVGRYGNSGQLVYSATKGAVIALTKTAAKELAEHNIRVNAIAPGSIDTDLIKGVDQKHMNEKIQNIGMGRLGTAVDVANAALFLASDLSSYVTGQILGIDGAAVI